MSCQTSSGYNAQSEKYNWSNVLAEYKNGADNQQKLGYFKDIRVDYNYNYKLYGPYNPGYLKQRLTPGGNSETCREDGSDDIRNIQGFGTSEGFRGPLSYSNWSNASKFREKANTLTHYVINPNVNQFFITLQINTLSDLLQESQGSYPEYQQQAGDQYPHILKFNVKWGQEDRFGNKRQCGYREFNIRALVSSPALLDIGNPDDTEGKSNSLNFTSANLSDIFYLPPVANPENASDLDVTFDEKTIERRFVEVEKMTAETNSSLILCDILLAKITEVQESQFTYPYSVLVGTKLDSRVFSQIPKRTFDCKLKKIKIPNNYYPLNGDGVDKRYISSWDGNPCAGVYQGNWDGTFKIGWTDNPAWVLYDMLSNPRYGLGNYIKEENINKWDLYKIARWCDGVDEAGNYIGVSDYKFGREPRFAANIMFSAQTAIFDAINAIVAIFRGAIYYQNDKIEFSDDRPRPSIAFFNNHNVKDGIFSYSNYKKDEQYNSVEVVYIDKNDDYRTKSEYVQNNEDIGKRGPVSRTVNAIGCTSAGQARRVGLNLIYQTIIENQAVIFDCGYEAMLCKPGDYIEIEDELKTHTNNYGRIMEVDSANGYLRLNNPYNENEYSNVITVYVPNDTTVGDQNQLNFELGSLNQTVEMEIESFSEDDEFGCYVWIKPSDPNYNLIGFVQAGTAYRFRKKTELSSVYKILSIKENDKSDFSIVAQKYDPSRFDYVEDIINYGDGPGDEPCPDVPTPYTCGPIYSNTVGGSFGASPLSLSENQSIESIQQLGYEVELLEKQHQTEENKTEKENTNVEFKLNKLNGDGKEKEDSYLTYLDPLGYSSQPTKSE